MPEPGDEQLSTTPRSARVDRAEAVATLVALVWASAVAIVFAVYGGSVSLVGLLAISPFIAAPFARPSRVALVGILTAFFALVISTPPHSYGQLNHTAACRDDAGGNRGRDVDLVPARPAQRPAVDGPLRNQEREAAARRGRDGAAHADHGARAHDRRRPGPGGRRRLRRHARRVARGRIDLRPARRARDPAHAPPLRLRPRRPDRRRAGLAADRRPGPGSTTSPSSPRPSTTCSAIGPTSSRPSNSERFRALAIIPLVVSDHTIGAVVVHWDDDREISEPDRTFLFTITGAAAQAVERARLTLTEFVNLERSQHLHQLSSALAAATTPGDVAHAAIAGGRRALGAQSAVVRVPADGERGLACLASSGHPALLSRTMVPLEGAAPLASVSRAARPSWPASPPTTRCARTSTTEIVRPGPARAPKPVTIVSEPLIGSVGPLGVLSLAFVGQPEPSEPDLRFLSTLAGLTAQALERAQVFEHEREALRDAEAGRERLSLLSEVTRLLSSSLEPTTVIRRTMSLVEGRLADSCSVQVPGESGLVRLDVREPGPASPRRRRCRRTPDATSCRSLPTRRPPSPSARAVPNWRRSTRARRARATGCLHGPVRAADRQRRGHRRDDLRGRAGPGLRGGRRLAGHRGGEPGRGRPVQRHAVPAGARRGGRAAACGSAGLAARRRGSLARRRVPGRGRRDLRRRRLVRRLRARRRLPSSSAWATSWARAPRRPR